LGSHAADEREREQTAELSARAEALNVVQNRLDQLAADGRIAPDVLAILRARHDYRIGGCQEVQQMGSKLLPQPRTSGQS
jgi:hypothetical protein